MTVYRETVLTQTTAATAVTTQRGVISDVGAAGLGELDELLVYLEVVTAVTNGTLDVYLQRSLVPDPVAATDAHWGDYVHFTQNAAGNATDKYCVLPVRQVTSSVSADVDVVRDREHAALPADAALTGHWGDQLRVLEVIGAGVTVAGVYSIHITGYKR
jgi:hypothetical protein